MSVKVIISVKKISEKQSGKALISIEVNIRFIHFHHILACVLLYYFKSAREEKKKTLLRQRFNCFDCLCILKDVFSK